MKTPSREPRRAFTLVELLVAAALTAVLAALMLGITRAALELWRRAQDGFAAQAEAGFVLDYIERDLQAAVFRSDGQTWLAVDIINSPAALTTHGWLIGSVIKPGTSESRRYLSSTSGSTDATIVDARFGLGGAWLRFITTNIESKDSGNSGGSLPVAVAYQIARRPVSGAISAANPAAVRYTLFRSAVGNATTFTTGADVLAAGYVSSSSTPPSARGGRTLGNPNIADAIASNVVDFGLWLHIREADGGLRRIFPADESDEIHRAVTTDTFPMVVDVMVRVLTDEGVKQLAELEAGRDGLARPDAAMTDAAWWWSVVEAHSRVLTRRIEVKGRVR